MSVVDGFVEMMSVEILAGLRFRVGDKRIGGCCIALSAEPQYRFYRRLRQGAAGWVRPLELQWPRRRVSSAPVRDAGAGSAGSSRLARPPRRLVLALVHVLVLQWEGWRSCSAGADHNGNMLF